MPSSYEFAIISLIITFPFEKTTMRTSALIALMLFCSVVLTKRYYISTVIPCDSRDSCGECTEMKIQPESNTGQDKVNAKVTCYTCAKGWPTWSSETIVITPGATASIPAMVGRCNSIPPLWMLGVLLALIVAAGLYLRYNYELRCKKKSSSKDHSDSYIAADD